VPGMSIVIELCEEGSEVSQEVSDHCFHPWLNEGRPTIFSIDLEL
jgi:hypothetical protein